MQGSETAATVYSAFQSQTELILLLFDVLNNVLQYQSESNARLTYGIVRQRDLIASLSRCTLSHISASLFRQIMSSCLIVGHMMPCCSWYLAMEQQQMMNQRDVWKARMLSHWVNGQIK
eukprot:SAG31_NODE_229_length_19770_cov_9.887194_19_plen_119_part_00